jgi:hypothetical protein
MSEATGSISDGYHTFDELYEHRHALYAAFASADPDRAWKSLKHDDGTMFDGWFIAGMSLPAGNISYHLPMRLWDTVTGLELSAAPKWDGHTPNDVVSRLKAYANPVT